MIWTLLLQSLPAFPCAALTVREGEFASSDAQEVILRRTEDGSEVSYRVTYDGDASEFGWIIVVPGEVSDVTEGDEDRFSELRDQTDPVVQFISSGGDSESGGCGCMASAKMSDKAVAGDVNFADDPGVDIVSEGFAGPYEYTVLSAEDETDLIDWLDAHEFDLGGSETTLAEYVNEGGYSFVAVTLTPDEALTPEAGSTLPPLDIQTDSTELRFPARMAQTGAPEWVRTTVWVEGSSTASIVDGWTSEDLSWLNSRDQDPSDFYAQHLQDLAGAEPIYARIFTGEIDGSWVTRFDTYAARGVHIADPIFEYETDQTNHRLEIVGDNTDAAWLLLPFIGLGWGLRRRYRSDST